MPSRKRAASPTAAADNAFTAAHLAWRREVHPHSIAGAETTAATDQPKSAGDAPGGFLVDDAPGGFVVEGVPEGKSSIGGEVGGGGFLVDDDGVADDGPPKARSGAMDGRTNEEDEALDYLPVPFLPLALSHLSPEYETDEVLLGVLHDVATPPPPHLSAFLSKRAQGDDEEDNGDAEVLGKRGHRVGGVRGGASSSSSSSLSRRRAKARASEGKVVARSDWRRVFEALDVYGPTTGQRDEGDADSFHNDDAEAAGATDELESGRRRRKRLRRAAGTGSDQEEERDVDDDDSEDDIYEADSVQDVDEDDGEYGRARRSRTGRSSRANRSSRGKGRQVDEDSGGSQEDDEGDEYVPTGRRGRRGASDGGRGRKRTRGTTASDAQGKQARLSDAQLDALDDAWELVVGRLEQMGQVKGARRDTESLRLTRDHVERLLQSLGEKLPDAELDEMLEEGAKLGIHLPDHPEERQPLRRGEATVGKREFAGVMLKARLL